MTDEFFDDEQELMEGSAPATRTAFEAPVTRDAEETAPATAAVEEVAAPKGTRTPPPFWMVLAIAAIALLLGVIIGYLLGSSATLSALEAQSMAAQEQVSEDADAYALPEGHPSVEVDEDGSAHVVEDADAASADAA